MKVRIQTTSEMLGTNPGDPDIYQAFIATKARLPEDIERAKEQAEALPASELEEKGTTVFLRKNGLPAIPAYHVKGLVKEFIGSMLDLGLFDWKHPKVKITRWTYKRIVDKGIYVSPDLLQLHMPEGASIGHCVRPLRAQTLRGERICLACSESVPAGTWLECDIECRVPELEKVVVDALTEGRVTGLGQWRGGGKGTFTFERQ